MVIGLVVGIAGLGWAAAHAEDTTCKIVFDALAKSAVTPSHQYTALKMEALNGGKAENTETINTGKGTYIKHDGKWKLGTTAKAMLDQMNENRKNGKSTCHFVRDEAIDGVSASLYAVHEDEGPDSKVWLSKADGLPVHVNLEMEGMQSEARYVYGAVSAPPLN